MDLPFKGLSEIWLVLYCNANSINDSSSACEKSDVFRKLFIILKFNVDDECPGNGRVYDLVRYVYVNGYVNHQPKFQSNVRVNDVGRASGDVRVQTANAYVRVGVFRSNADTRQYPLKSTRSKRTTRPV